MTGTLSTLIKPKFYLDSVALMRHSKVIAGLDGIIEAAMMMGTPANIQIMQNAGLLDSPLPPLEGGDLVISVRASESSIAEGAIAAAIDLLEQPKAQGASSRWRPRSVRSAVESTTGANLALVSVPGQFAVSEARKAIRRGLDAMIFSDNVPLEDEVGLKNEAQTLGRLVMGPDCGTAIVNGIPLAFANVVPRGRVGIIGASGTGVQEVSCLIAGAGEGISHALGVGGRDLHQSVGGVSTLMAMDMLEQDDATEHVVIISKPPAEKVASDVLSKVGQSSKTFTICFIGDNRTEESLPPNARLATTLKQAAELALGKTLFGNPPEPLAEARNAPVDGKSTIVGLYSGGTLCAEAQVILNNLGLSCASNAPVPGSRLLDSEPLEKGQPDASDNPAEEHILIDLGADEYTQGRPHPMIEPSVRDTPLVTAASRADVAAILLDVVIGYGAHPDPATHLVQSLEALSVRPLIVASVTGTEADPQVLSRQCDILSQAGILVAPSNADAVLLATQACSQPQTIS